MSASGNLGAAKPQTPKMRSDLRQRKAIRPLAVNVIAAPLRLWRSQGRIAFNCVPQGQTFRFTGILLRRMQKCQQLVSGNGQAECECACSFIVSGRTRNDTNYPAI